jgi:hypothetical protein
MFRKNVQELSDGVISANELYTLSKFGACLKLSASAVRSLRLAGLPVIRFGKRAFVSGRQAMEFLEQWGNEHRGKSKGCVSPE